MIIIICIIIGLILGLLSGLLGIGGGLIAVPTLSWLFNLHQVPFSLQMHLAIGSSLAGIIFTSLFAVRAFHAQHAVVWPAFFKLLPGVLLGTIVGLIVSSHLSTHGLRILFALMVLYTAIRLFRQSNQEIADAEAKTKFLNQRLLLALGAFATGMLAGLLGVGGSILMVPFLLYGGFSMREASGTSVACAIPIAILGAIGMVIIGWQTPGLPLFSTGFINWPGALGLSIPSLFSVNLGARLGKVLPHRILKKIFAGFLILVSIDMLFLK